MMNRKGYILDLGLIDYQKAWELQHHFWYSCVKGELPELLIILEHPHVITLGRRGNLSNLIAPEEVLKEMKIPLFYVERGGDITYHGPGQLVVYPILNLKEYGYRLISYVDQLEEIIIRTLKDFGIESKRDASNRGVWVDGKKIASIGLAVRKWTSFHGFALNYNTELKYFDLINPCGLKEKKMTSMAEVLGKYVLRDGLVERIVFYFCQLFQGEWEKKELKELIRDSKIKIEL